MVSPDKLEVDEDDHARQLMQALLSALEQLLPIGTVWIPSNNFPAFFNKPLRVVEYNQESLPAVHLKRVDTLGKSYGKIITVHPFHLFVDYYKLSKASR
jgi:hypothetical protein